MEYGILDEVRGLLRDANIIKTDREFCETWLGKSECYMRSLRFAGRAPSADALANCASRLAWAAGELRSLDAIEYMYWIEQMDTMRLQCYRAMEQYAVRRLYQKGLDA